jgi:hypothetical protein
MIILWSLIIIINIYNSWIIIKQVILKWTILQLNLEVCISILTMWFSTEATFLLWLSKTLLLKAVRFLLLNNTPRYSCMSKDISEKIQRLGDQRSVWDITFRKVADKSSGRSLPDRLSHSIYLRRVCCWTDSQSFACTYNP